MIPDIDYFDDVALRAMGAAFDKACRDPAIPRSARDAIARRIVEIAAAGERDAEKIYEQIAHLREAC